ncbi:hypothetical protein N825_09865 [Skermanella stibiiresistens SB22]|uniref:TadE-like domain-containing protein n=1 Tax=Skermanella stibiiresistens SB22 TaxID=1385369 RepID=W9GYT8_9PROT|nr:TadE/TadG family type IV pilus assembly protein [Skermanella stibiiresistens]EWY36618.1 hypothetical protein N825_09865 [Skermanella stibiiresistens SB22]
MRSGGPKGWLSRRGTTALEFALLSPLLVLLIIATVEFGYGLTVQNVLELAARKASRTGVTGSPPPDGVTREQMLRDLVVDTGMGLINPSRLTVVMTAYDGFSSIGHPEPCIDANNNGVCDRGEAFTDVNGNGRWDADQGASNAGAGGQVVIYTLTYTDAPLTGMIAGLVAKSPLTYSARVVVRNEPFRS